MIMIMIIRVNRGEIPRLIGTPNFLNNVSKIQKYHHKIVY